MTMEKGRETYRDDSSGQVGRVFVGIAVVGVGKDVLKTFRYGESFGSG